MPPRRHDLFMGFISTRTMRDAVDGTAFIDALEAHTPEWAPSRWGYDDPPSIAFDHADIAKMWGGNLSWTGRGKGRPSGSVFPADSLPVARIALSAASSGIDADRAGALLQALASIDGLYGYVHLVDRNDLSTSAPHTITRYPVDNLSMFPYSPGLATDGLPNVWWANLFGPALVEVLGAERIATAPAHTVVHVGDDCWYLQLTETYFDNQTDPDGFNRARAAVKDHLGLDAFWDSRRGPATRLPQLPQPGSRLPRPKATVVRYGPEGFTQEPSLKARWEPWAEPRDRGVWALRDLPADALIDLVAALPEDNRTSEVNGRPTLDQLATVAHAHPLARFAGTVVGPRVGTEGVDIDHLWLPPDIDDPDIELIAADAETDTTDRDGRNLRWA